jgi:hypothetical protein
MSPGSVYEGESLTVAARSIDFSSLIAEIPNGAWVALSHDGSNVISFGSDMNEVLEEARSSGESDPIIIRIPETPAAVML